ncbi:hypothetical protein P389DRAFT_211489 [Cystobasidium minutum MCA 4210]|uniref:uncharacterized protein n=1 Tax=Cystobasidium minutum MCA 4210 TaxID=1397322 RepID=UPI0034CD4BAA|eukprot:jgi/Rhomi1/211489/estExt_Genemark1.C_5_t10004
MMPEAAHGPVDAAQEKPSSRQSLALLQEAVKLDAAKFSGPGGATHLIIYLDGLKVLLESTDNQQDVLEVSTVLKQTLQELWASSANEESLRTSSLCAGVPCRNLLCQIYTALFSKLEGSGLFDAANTWVNLALSNATRSEIRITALHVYATVLSSALGDLIPSLASQHLVQLLRVFRDRALTYRLRHAASRAAASSLAISGQSLPLAESRDAARTLKACLAHESGIIQRGAAECLSRLFNASYVLQNMTDIEQVLNVSFKAQDTADWRSRQQHVELCSTLLLLTQVPRTESAVQAPAKRPLPSEGDSQAKLEMTPDQPAKVQEPTTLLSVQAMIARIASAYNKSGGSWKGRSSAMQVMTSLFIRLEAPYLCENFPAIWEALLEGFVNGAYANISQHNSQVTQQYLAFILGKIVFEYLFHEEEQLATLRYFSNQLNSPLEANPSHTVYAAQQFTLRMIQLLLPCFGPSTTPEILQLEKPLLRLCRQIPVDPSSPKTWISAFACAAPSRLHSLTLDLLGGLESLLHSQATVNGMQMDDLRKLSCQTSALASLIPLLRRLRISASDDICARLVSLAAGILKKAGDLDLATSETMITCAWKLYSSLLTLQASLVTVHLPQILLLWRNALPKPSPRDLPQAGNRTMQEWTFLFSIRAAALKSIVSFLEYKENHEDQGDVTRRIVALLNHAMIFEASAPQTSQSASDDRQHRGNIELEISRAAFMSNLLQAFARVQIDTYTTANRTALSNLCLAQIALLRAHAGHQQAGAGRENTIPPIWELSNAPQASARGDAAHAFDAQTPSFDIEAGLATKDYVLEALPRRRGDFSSEGGRGLPGNGRYTAAAASAALLDRAGYLLAALFPFLESTKQLAILGMLAENTADSTGPVHSNKQMSSERLVFLSLLTLIALKLEQARKDAAPLEDNVLVALSGHLSVGLTNADAVVRERSGRGIASLIAVGSSSFLSARIQSAIGVIVTDTQPHVRAGYILLLAEMYKAAGAIAARPALQTLVDVAMTLVQDPHPIVHYWALRALALIVETAGLDFTPYVMACLVMLAKMLLCDTHDPEGGTSGTSHLRGDLPVRQAMTAVLDQIIVAAGPALCDEEGTSRATISLVRSFLLDDDVRVKVQAGSALQHLLLVLSPEKLDAALIQIPVNQLFSPNLQVQVSAVNSIYQIVRRDAPTMSKLGGDKLVDRLFTILDADPLTEGVKQTIATWMSQTATANAAGWLTICQRVLSQGLGNWQVRDVLPHKQLVEDEEAQGLGSMTIDGRHRTHLARWQTRSFALSCLTSLVKQLGTSSSITSDALPGDSFVPAARKLHGTLPDLVRLALLASTSVNTDIRVRGLGLLQAIIKTFQHARDVNYDGAPLLEQYQASIIAAAGPAFEADAEPDFHVAAIKLCGHFVAAQTSSDLGASKRAIKHLERSLDSMKGSNLSPSTVPVQIACGAAWARICIAAQSQPSLNTIVRANSEALMQLWQTLLLDSGPPEAGEYPLIDETEECQTMEGVAMDLESWLLILKAWTLLSRQTLAHSRPNTECGVLLGDLCYYINRYLLAETIRAASESIAAILLECLIGLLYLKKSSTSSRLDMKVFNELLQICMRLNLLANSTVDRYIPHLVMGLAAVLPQELPSAQTEACLLSCHRLILVVMRRNLEQDDSASLAASAWQASLTLSGFLPEARIVGSIALPWAVLHDCIQASNLSELPAVLLHSVQMAAEHVIRQADLPLLDQILMAFILGFQRCIGRTEARVQASARGHLHVLSVLFAEAMKASVALAKPTIHSLCQCAEQALCNGDQRIKAGGLALARTLSSSDSVNRLQAPLAIARITSRAFALLGQLSNPLSKSGTLPEAILFHLVNGIGRSSKYTRALILDGYIWLSSRNGAAHASSCVQAISTLAVQAPSAFKNFYITCSPTRQHALQALLKQTSSQGLPAETNGSVAPTIELRSFSS